ncbi:amidohydrolase family protein [Ideonella livida]|uniref:Amidohydrolase family protein n=1 Tax=Ideonella livida TaxID=2707176 RepID=A0A7C9PJC1_9BURK|nr:amidohydrolase family protein [Ideonella livida]NDY93328.1 amidohydrolase family protein [Ideonella livida]
MTPAPHAPAGPPSGAAHPIGVTDGVDCHFHVIAPPEDAPMAPGRSYTPAPAPLAAWRARLGGLGLRQGVVVQPSLYGTDARVLLDALAQGGGALVGVAAATPEVDEATLDRWAEAGVRGLRMAHFEPGDPRALSGFVHFEAAFDALAPRMAARGWHLQLLTDSRLLPALAPRLRRSPVPVVLDHMGRTPARLGTAHAGMQSLCALLAEGVVWVKLSGVANVSEAAPGYEDARAVHDALLAAAPERLVWGSDWPHTRPQGEVPDTAALLRHFLAWTPEAWHAPILCRQPRALYGLPDITQPAAASV